MDFIEVKNWLDNLVKKKFCSSIERLDGVGLLYLYYEIWKKYGIKLSKQQIEGMTFLSTDEIAYCIVDHMK